MTNTGYPGIMFSFEFATEPSVNQDIELLCIIDDFGTSWQDRAEGGGVKRFPTIKQAINSGDFKNGAKGLPRLELFAQLFGRKLPVILADLTGVDGDTSTETFNSARFAECLEKLERYNFSVLAIPDKMAPTDHNVLKVFYDEQVSKMNLFGVICQIENASELMSLKSKFPKGGILKATLTPQKFVDGIELSLEDTVIYEAGITISNKPNISETWTSRDGVVGELTPDILSKPDFDIMQNNGGVIIDIIDGNNEIVGNVNSNTPAGKDIKIIRSINNFFNTFRTILNTKYGSDNDPPNLIDIISLVKQLREKKIKENIVADARVETEKATENEDGEPVTNQINATAVLDIYDIIFKFDVTGLVNVI